MKVLFVGEGAHDIGKPEFNPQPRPAAGVVTILSRKVCPQISANSVALAWREIVILDRAKRSKGLAAKVASALLLAKKNGCDGAVCVADRDCDSERLKSIEDAAATATTILAITCRVACGVAVESIEAWTLGAPKAIAEALGIEAVLVQKHYHLKDVESFYQNSGKPEKRPKVLLERILALKHEPASTALREQIAELTAIAVLEKNCHHGFRPFAERLRSAFVPDQA